MRDTVKTISRIVSVIAGLLAIAIIIMLFIARSEIKKAEEYNRVDTSSEIPGSGAPLEP